MSSTSTVVPESRFSRYRRKCCEKGLPLKRKGIPFIPFDEKGNCHLSENHQPQLSPLPLSFTVIIRRESNKRKKEHPSNHHCLILKIQKPTGASTKFPTQFGPPCKSRPGNLKTLKFPYFCAAHKFQSVQPTTLLHKLFRMSWP